MNPEDILRQQELTIANLNCRVARQEKRIGDLLRIKGNLERSIDTLRRQMKADAKTEAERFFSDD